MLTNSVIEERYIKLLEAISKIHNTGIEETDEQCLKELITLINENPASQLFFEIALLEIAKTFQIAGPSVIRSVLEILQWEGVRDRLTAMKNSSTSERYRHMLRGVLMAYQRPNGDDEKALNQ